MSSIVVQVGQCGNQIGQVFWDFTSNDPSCENSLAYRNGDNFLRSIHVDSEPKVLAKITCGSNNPRIRQENVISCKEGRGGNWALGYNGYRHKENGNILESTLNAVRKECERCDSFSGIILMHSLAGGTGSGVGSRLLETFRDEYPLQYQLSCAVAPHRLGENPLQHYNMLLSLAWIQRYVDGLLLFHNDDVLERMEKKSDDLSTCRGVTLQSMNRHIASCLGGLLLPTESITAKPRTSIGQEPWELIRSVSPMPAVKIFNANSVCKSKLSWDSMTSRIIQGYKKYNTDGVSRSSIAVLGVCRGGCTSLDPDPVIRKLRSGYECVSWNPFPVDLWIEPYNSLGKSKYSASLTTAANSTNIIDFLDHTWGRAKLKYDSKAFLHWYWKHGCEEIIFEEAFNTLQTIAQDYSDIGY